jgi:hypothetical protein
VVARGDESGSDSKLGQADDGRDKERHALELLGKLIKFHIRQCKIDLMKKRPENSYQKICIETAQDLSLSIKTGKL